MEKAKNIFVSLLRDAAFGTILFLVIVTLALVSSKATQFIYAMF